MKHRKIDPKNQQKIRFLKKQKKKEEFWDEHKNFWLESSFDESDFVEFSFDRYSSVEKNLDKKEKRGEEGTKK